MGSPFLPCLGQARHGPGARYDELLRELELCDPRGFDYCFAVEQQFSPDESSMSSRNLYAVGVARHEAYSHGGDGPMWCRSTIQCGSWKRSRSQTRCRTDGWRSGWCPA